MGPRRVAGCMWGRSGVVLAVCLILPKKGLLTGRLAPHTQRIACSTPWHEWFSDVNCQRRKAFCTTLQPFLVAPRHNHKQRYRDVLTINKCFTSPSLLECCCKSELNSNCIPAGRIVGTTNQAVCVFWSLVELSSKSMCPKRAMLTCLWGSRGMSRPSDLDIRYLLLYVDPIFLPSAGASDPAAVPTHDVVDALETSPNRRTKPRLLVCILICTSTSTRPRNQGAEPFTLLQFSVLKDLDTVRSLCTVSRCREGQDRLL